MSLFLSLGWSCIVSRYMPCIVLERRIGFAVPLGTPAAAFSTLNAATCHAITKSFHIAFSAQKCFASVTFRNFKYCLRYSVFSIREEADYTDVSFAKKKVYKLSFCCNQQQNRLIFDHVAISRAYLPIGSANAAKRAHIQGDPNERLERSFC